MKRKVVVILGLSLIFLLGLFVYQLIKFSDNRFHVVFCDVGQGDGIFMRTPSGTDILVDGGPDDKILSCLEENMPFWDRSIELMFATHPDADHITGLLSVVRRYKVKAYYTSILKKDTGVFDQLTKELEVRRIPVKQLEADDVFKTKDGVVIKTLWPQKEYRDALPDADTNLYSLVQYITHHNFSVLLTGDITFDILNQLMDEVPKIDIFKAPHHGSYTGFNEETFDHVRPRLVIISSGKNNRYGHPHPSVLKVLKENNINYRRTDKEGTIKFEIGN